MCKTATLEQLKAMAGGKDIKPYTKGYKSNVQGWRNIGGRKKFYKSLWEINYARYLDYCKKRGLILRWYYEPELFKYPEEMYEKGPYYYKPDFLVYLNETDRVWREVKGYMNYASMAKIRRFRENYPDERLEIIDEHWFKKALHTWRWEIPGWEIYNGTTSA